MNLFAVVANYGHAPHLNELVQHLSEDCDAEVIVVNNDPDRGAPVNGKYASIIDNTRNVGVSGAWNTGIRIAVQNGATHILVCGNDTMPFKGTVARLSKLIDDGALFVTGTATTEYPNGACVARDAPGETLLAAPDFSFFMMHPEAIQRVGVHDASLDAHLRKKIEATGKALDLPATCMPPHMYGLFDERYFPCVDPNTPVLKDDLTWVKAGSLQAGDSLIGVDEEIPGPRVSRSYRRSKVEAVKKLKAPCLRVYLSDGSSLTCTKNHRWLRKASAATGAWGWLTARELKVGDRLYRPMDVWGTPDGLQQSFDFGWLAGMFDGEGCLRIADKMRGIGLSQKEGPVLDKALAILDGMEIAYKTYYRDDGVANVEINSKRDCYRLLGTLRPLRLMRDEVWEGVRVRSGRADVKIVEIEDVGKRDVIDLQTSTATYLANGFVSHNSYFEDNDYHTRLHYAGVQAVRDPGALFWHECSNSLKTVSDESRDEIDEGFKRNLQLFKDKWGQEPQGIGITSAKPLNISQEDWDKMSGGRPVEEIPRGVQEAQADVVYSGARRFDLSGEVGLPVDEESHIVKKVGEPLPSRPALPLGELRSDAISQLKAAEQPGIEYYASNGSQMSKDKMWLEEVSSVVQFMSDAERGADIGSGGRTIYPGTVRVDASSEHRPHIIADAKDLGDIGSFDWIYAGHVIEHMVDPRAAISHWLGYVKPGGHLCLVIPNTLFTRGQNTDASPHYHEWSPREFVKGVLGFVGSENWFDLDPNGNLLDFCNGEVVSIGEAAPNWSFHVVIRRA